MSTVRSTGTPEDTDRASGQGGPNAVTRSGSADPRPGEDAVVGQAGGRRGRAGRKGSGGKGERSMVPPAEFTSYYGRPIVKAAPWEHDIPAYLFMGGVAAGSSLLAAGADLTDRPALRRTGRLGAVVGLTVSMLALVHDLGRP